MLALFLVVKIILLLKARLCCDHFLLKPWYKVFKGDLFHFTNLAGLSEIGELFNHG